MEKVNVAWCKIDNAGVLYGDIEWDKQTLKEIEQRAKTDGSLCALVHIDDAPINSEPRKAVTREEFANDPKKYGVGCYAKGPGVAWE